MEKNEKEYFENHPGGLIAQARSKEAILKDKIPTVTFDEHPTREEFVKAMGYLYEHLRKNP